MAEKSWRLYLKRVLFLFLVSEPLPLVSESVIFDHLTVVDGLVDNHVSGIVQDRRGYLWFGTQNGLNRYDGKNYRIYDNQAF